MTDLQAGIGRVQLERLAHIIARRRSIAAAYHRLLANIPEVRPPEEPTWARSNWQSYCVGVPRHADQQRLMQFMLDNGIATRRGIMCAHMEEAYDPPQLRFSLPVSEQIRDGSILLPILWSSRTRISRGLPKCSVRPVSLPHAPCGTLLPLLATAIRGTQASAAPPQAPDRHQPDLRDGGH
jgi:DegT/DnrJ/EryC1/StrS aminotransferase family